MALNITGVFCEDIREEKSGQVTLIGILPDNLNVPAPPPEAPPKSRAILPKLALYIRLFLKADEPIVPVKLKLTLPWGTDFDLGGVNKEIIERAQSEAKANGLPIAGAYQQATFQGFQIEKPGLIQAIAETEEETFVFAVLQILQPKPS